MSRTRMMAPSSAPRKRIVPTQRNPLYLRSDDEEEKKEEKVEENECVLL